MKKHVIATYSVCLFLVVISGFYLNRRYVMQVEARKELMVCYVSDVKTKLDVITSSIRELPHIVKPILAGGELDKDHTKKFPEEISLFERFYIDNYYFISRISVFNRNGDTFNLYLDSLNGEFTHDIYRSRSISNLHSIMGVAIENNSFSIVMPVYHGKTLSGNVSVNLDILSLQQEIFKPYNEKGNLWLTFVLDEETLMTLPLDEEWVLSCEKDISTFVQERKSGFFTGKIKGTETSARTVTYFESLMIPEYHLGIAFSSNTSPLLISTYFTFAVACFILILLATVAYYFLNRMIVKNRETLNKKDKEINVLQIIYDNSPVAFIVHRNSRFFTANNYFFKMFEGFASLDDARQLNLPFKAQQEFTERETRYEEMEKEYNEGKIVVASSNEKFSFEIMSPLRKIECPHCKKENKENLKIACLSCKNEIKEIKIEIPFKIQQEYKEWDLCTFEKFGREITLARKHISFDLDGDKYSIDSFWNISEMDLRLKEAIRSKMTKSELLSRISSDVIKTLGNVRDAATLLGQHLPEERHLEYINTVTTNLSGLVESVHDYANIESGRIVLDEVPFNLVDEIKKLKEKYYMEAKQKGIDIQTIIPSSTVRNVVGDPQRFRQIFDELLSNAIRNTEKGYVRIFLETTKLQKRKIEIKCSVDDTGQGMTNEKYKKLFSPDRHSREQTGPIGLGIIITNKLVQMMGGKLRFSSPSPISTNPSAPGVQFSFTLNCYSDQPHDKNLDYSSIVSCREINTLIITSDRYRVQNLENFLNRRGTQTDIFIYDKESADILVNKLIIDKSRYQMVVIATGNSETSFTIASEIHRKGLAEYCLYIFVDTQSQKGNYIKAKFLNIDYYTIAGNDLSIYDSILTTHFPNLSYDDKVITDLVRKDLRILIADHNELGQMVAQMIFKKMGYKVDFAPNAICLENLFEQKSYDIVFIDLKFPPDGGFKIVEMLRTKKNKIPIIAMTSTLTKENLKHITDCGMNGYLSKPLNPDNIKQILIKWFS